MEKEIAPKQLQNDLVQIFREICDELFERKEEEE